MPARLTVHFPHRPSRSFLAEEGAEYVIGRGAECDILLEDDRISRRHARLWIDNGRWLIQDLDSKNGTAVNGMSAEQVELDDGVWLSFGGLVGRFEIISAEESQARDQRWLERWQTSLVWQRELTRAEGLDELLQRVLKSVLSLSGAERGFVMLASPTGDLEVLASAGISRDDMQSREFSGSVGAIEQVLEKQSPVATSDAQIESVLGERPSVITGGIRAVVCIPLQALDRMLGVIYADSRKPGAAFDHLDVEILSALASHAALALAVTRIDGELKSLLQGLPARMGLDPESGTQLRHEIEGALDRSLPVYKARRKRRGARQSDTRTTTWSEVVGHHRGETGA